MEIISEKGGGILLKNPFGNAEFVCDKNFEKDGGLIKIKLAKGDKATLKAKNSFD